MGDTTPGLGPTSRPTVFVQGGAASTRDAVQRDLIDLTPVARPRLANLIVLLESTGESFGERLERIRNSRRENASAAILFLAAMDRSDGSAAAAFRDGVTDYLQWPADRARLLG